MIPVINHNSITNFITPEEELGEEELGEDADNGEEDAVEEIYAEPFTHNGIQYLKKIDDGTLYNVESEEMVGKWNGESIEECNEEE